MKAPAKTDSKAKTAHSAIPHKGIGTGPKIKYSKVEVMDLKAVFLGHDLNGDGKVTPNELYKSLQTNKHFSAQGREAFRALDLNGDGVLTFDEYLKACFPLASKVELGVMHEWAYPTPEAPPNPLFLLTKEQKEDIQRMFNMYDQDHNGKIERKELKAMAVRCGYEEGETDVLFSSMDKNNDQSLSVEEFTELMASSFIG